MLTALVVGLLPAVVRAATPGGISGKVTASSTGAGIGGIEVTAYKYNETSGGWDWAAKTTARPDGVYKITQLAAGTYRVGFSDPKRAYATPWFHGDATMVSAATDVTVGAGIVSGVDVTLRQGSRITGLVSDNAGAPLAGISVAVSASYNDGLTLGSAVTADDGTYDVGGLPGGWVPGMWGYFNVRFHDSQGTYGDATSFWVQVDTGSTVAGINATLHIVGSIAGRVTGADGGPSLAGVAVQLYQRPYWAWGWDEVGYRVVDDTGGYSFGGLIAGEYRLGFSDQNGVYQTEFYDNSAYFDSGTSLYLEEGQYLTRIDAKLGLVGAASAITGRVTSEAGEPLAGVKVTLATAAGPDGEPAVTDDTGAYTLPCDPGNQLYVAFAYWWDPGDVAWAGDWAGEFYDDSPDIVGATPLSVGPGDNVDGIDARLAPAGHVTGHIEGQNGGTFGAWADAFRRSVTGSWEWCGDAYADENGDYDLDGLPAGTYHVRFGGMASPSAEYLTEYYDDAPDMDGGQDIVVTAGQTVPGIDARLATRSEITGRVRDADGDPLGGVRARLYVPDGSGGWMELNEVWTDDTGGYAFGGLDAGTYRLSFTAEWYRGLATEWYHDSPDVQHAADVGVGTSATATLDDVVLEPWGQIGGQVTGAGQGPLSGVYVEAYTYRDYGGYGYWEWMASASSDESGRYVLGGLAAGAYRLHFVDGQYGYGSEWYDNAAFRESAIDVPVSHCGTTDGIDIVLGDGGRIQGAVADSAMAPLDGVEVTAFVADPSGGWISWGVGTTDALGHYDLGGLLAGTYRLLFHDPQRRVADRYYQDADDVASATDVPVAAGVPVMGIDMTLGGAHITGAVSDAEGGLLAGIEVTGYRGYSGGGWYEAFVATTGDNGSYDLKGLPAGTYRVGFHDPSGHVLDQYYPAAGDYWSAEDITLERDQTLGGVDASLALAGHITGTVTTDGGAGLAQINAAAFMLMPSGDWQQISGGGYTDEDGFYDIGGLAAGTYRVWFQDQLHGLPWEYYDDVDDLSLATDIEVGAGEIVPGIDAALLSSHIAGTVTDTVGNGLEGVTVTVYLDNQWGVYEVATGTTGLGGRYDIGGLQPGRYVLGFHDPEGRVSDSYYDGADFFWEVTYIDLARVETRQVDVALEGARGVAGTVTSASSGEPLEGITVEAHRVATCGCCDLFPEELVGTATTDAQGRYDLSIARSPGSMGYYALRFIDPGRAYLNEWYDDIYAARDLIGTEQLWIDKGQTFVVDGQLDLAGHITGNVTNPDGTPFTAGGTVWADPDSQWGESWIAHADIGADGTYDVGGLAPGSYVVRFQPEWPYVGEWWNDWTEWPGHASDPYPYRVDVGLSQVRDGVDAVLSAPRTISGHVLDGSEQPLAQVRVDAYRKTAEGTWAWLAFTVTDDHGDYEFTANEQGEKTLRDGTYRLRFSRTSFEDGGTLVARWWPDAGSRDEAQDIVVGMTDITGKDMTMTEAAGPVMPSYTYEIDVAAASWDERPPDDSPLWRDATSEPGLTVLGDQDLQCRLKFVNTGEVALFVDSYSGEMGFTVQPGETAYARTSIWGGDFWVTAYDSFGGSFYERHSGSAVLRLVDPGVSVKKYVSTSGDPDGQWWDGDAAEDCPTVLTRSDIYCKFVVTNTGNGSLANVTLTDDAAEVASRAELPVDDPETPQNEAVWTEITGPLPAAAGFQQDIARVAASFTDDFEETWTSDPDAWDHVDLSGYLGKAVMLDLAEEIGTSAGGPWYEEALAPPVAVGSKLYYRVTVPYSSVIVLSGVPVMDLQGTPDDPGDDTVIGTIDITPGIDQVWTKVIGPVTAKYGAFTDWAGVSATWDDSEESARDDASYVSKYLTLDAAWWRTHPEKWGPTGYVPYDNPMAAATRVGEVFKASSMYSIGRKKAKPVSGFTLRQALGFSEGATLNAAAQRLLKAGTAAMLNARYAESWMTPKTTYPYAAGSPQAPYDNTTVTGKVNIALRDARQSGDASVMLKLAAELEGYNRGIAPW